MEEKETSSTKLNSFLEKNRKTLWIVLIAIVVCLVAFIVGSAVANSVKEKNLAAIDELSYTLTNESASLDEGELNARRIDALDNLQVYTKKSGIAGARANYLCAELSYQQKKYEDAINYYKATAEKAKKSYLAPIAYFNMAVCYEQLNNADEASNYYKIAADNKNFAMNEHAKFSYARILESQNKYADAVAAYNELIDASPDDSWAKLAKTRVIVLQSEGKAE